MTFEGQYLTKGEYITLGGNPEIGDMPFNLLEFEARKQIDLRTQMRLKNIDSEDIPNEVKICVFHLMSKIDEYAKEDIKTSGNKASENTDGYSVSYFTGEQITQIIELHKVELEDIMMSDLYGVVVNNVAILYNGVI